jgi:hypothetical protein
MTTIDLIRHRTPWRKRTLEKAFPSPMIARLDLLQQPPDPH